MAVLRAEGQAPGARAPSLRYRLVAGSDRLEVELLLDKLPVREKESAHLTFDLAVEGGRPADRPGHEPHGPGAGRPPRLLPRLRGASTAPSTPSGRRAASRSASLDSPLVELGTIVDERPNPAGIRHWKQEAYAGTTVHAYLLNNYWHTNYKADQQGLLRFRFVLRPHGVERPLAVMDLSRDLEQPLVVLPARGDEP